MIRSKRHAAHRHRDLILHPWTGTLTCASPVRGRWGGPPAGQQQIATQPATNLAFVPRGNVQLASMVARDLPEIGVLASNPQQLPPAIRQPQGCGCHAAGGAQALAGFAVLGLVVLRRRRRS